MSKRSPGSSPDPIVLPSSPPSAHNRGQLGFDGAHDQSRSPSKRLHSAESRRRTTPARNPGPDNDGELTPRAARRQERRQRQALRRERDTTDEPAAEPITVSARKRRREDRQQRREQRQKLDDGRESDSLISLAQVSAANYRPVDFERPHAPQAARVYEPSPAPQFLPSEGSSASADFDGDYGDVPGAYGADDGDSTRANEDFTVISGPSLASIANNLSFRLSRAEQAAVEQVDMQNDMLRKRGLYPDVTWLSPDANIASREVQDAIARSERGELQEYDKSNPRPRRLLYKIDAKLGSDDFRDTAARTQATSSAVRPSTTPAYAVPYRSPGLVAQQQYMQTSSVTKVKLRDVDENSIARPVVDSWSDDIWAEEASRSLQDDAQQSHDKAHGSQFIPPIFSDEPQPPPRAKIPATWRKTSGANFSYADSPPEQRLIIDAGHTPRRASRTRILTPPRSDAALQQPDFNATDGQEQSELTNPDAAGTRLEEVQAIDQSDQLFSGDLLDHEPTGMLAWPPHRPSKPRTPAKVDLSSILRLDKTSVEKRQDVQTVTQATPQSSKTTRFAPPYSSPTARLPSRNGQPSAKTPQEPVPQLRPTAAPTQLETEPVEDYENESEDDEESLEALQQDIDDESSSDEEPSHSYQEHLNLLSPGKHRMVFNDSSLQESLVDRLRPTKPVPRLFDQPQSMPPPQLGHVRPRNVSPTPSDPPAQPGLLARVGKSLWSAIVRPRGPIYVDPRVDDSTQMSFHEEDDPIFPSALRARLRTRYGVLSDQHPWTMTHMRTLHRMLNSLIEARADSIMPSSLALPPSLSRLIGRKQQSAVGQEFMFRYQHACAVNAFMQVLVPVSLVRAMERGEVEWLGDDIALSYRGFLGGRWGLELCFKTVRTPEGPVTREWLVQCIGCIVHANDETKRRELEESLRDPGSE